MACFDTDFLIAYLHNDPGVVDKLEDLQSGEDSAATTTTINAAELWKGAYRAKDRQKEIAKVRRLLDSLELVTLDRDSARMFGEMDAAMRSNPIGVSDLLIGCIALANKQTLVTRNRKHFARIPGLRVEGW